MKERWKQPRVYFYSIAKLTDCRKAEHYYGHVENLSESGFGLISPDIIPFGAQVVCNFFMEGVTKKLNPIATLVYSKEDLESMYRYGFKFEQLSNEDRRLVEQYVALKKNETTV